MPAFQNQVVLITGAASGLGRHLAQAMAAEGASIAGVDLNAERLAALQSELPKTPFAWVVADVTDEKSLRNAVEELEKQLGPIDILVASAGIGAMHSSLDFQADSLCAEIRVNLIGVINSVGAVLPGMIARRKGHLVAMSSLASYRGLPGLASYSASKAGVNALMDSWRVELRGTGVRLTTICPGWIRTPMTENLEMPMVHMMDVSEGARRIVAAIRRRSLFHAFPWFTLLRVRLLRWLPCRLSDWLVAMMLKKNPQA